MKKFKIRFVKVKIICFIRIFFQIPRNIILYLKYVVKNFSVHLREIDKFQYIEGNRRVKNVESRVFQVSTKCIPFFYNLLIM